MKQYKLIKEYPGSPKLGTIVNHAKGWGSYESYFDGNLVYSTYAIENYPEFWQEIKEPLFTTEDGVDIYEGDWYWYVYPKLKDRAAGNTAKKGFKPSSEYKYFSNRELAEKYLDKNKAKYSEKDIEKAFLRFDPHSINYVYANYIIKELLKLLKDGEKAK